MKSKKSNLAPLAVALAAFTITAPAADLHVPADYANLQAAIDAATRGDTIHLAAGIYSGDSLGPNGGARIVGKSDLTIIGQPGTILRAVPDMPEAIPNDILWRCLLFIHLTPNVDLRGLTFEGDQLAEQQGGGGLTGLYYLDCGGTVENCRFTGFREGVFGDERAAALRFVNDLPGAPLYSVRAAGNTIVDSDIGILVAGAPDKVSYDFMLEDNIISGVSPNLNNAVFGRRGIQLGRGATGSVRGNTISGFSYDGTGAEFPFAWGILAVTGIPGDFADLAPVRYENNTLRDNNLHMSLFMAHKHEVINNHFEGSAPSLRMVGLWFSGDDLVVDGNSFRDMPAGIRIGGDDGVDGFGTGLGIANDAHVSNNRFRNVATPIEIQPRATATEEGTLLYPFPAPEPTFQTALLISWPDYYDDWSLQCSTDMENWSFLNLSIIQQDGNSFVTVPAEEEHEFFRLIETAAP